MKKIGVIIFLTLLILPALAHAQANLDDLANDPIVEKTDELQEKYEDFELYNNKEEFLQKEWTKVFQNSETLSKIYKLNPVFKFLIGYEFELSWAFVTALILWFGILVIFYPVIKVSLRETFISLGTSFAISLIFAHLATPKIIDVASNTVKNLWQNLGFIVILVFVIVFFYTISKQVVKEIKKKQEFKRIQNLEQKMQQQQNVTGEMQSIQSGAKAMRRGSQQNP